MRLPSYDETLPRLVGAGLVASGPDANTGQVEARCPTHDDANASLSLGRGADGKALITCHAGCEPDKIVAALFKSPSGQKEFQRNPGKVSRVRMKPAKAIRNQGDPAAWHRRLLKSPAARLALMTEERGLIAETLDRYQIGWDGSRFTIPVRDADGTFINVRRYSPNPSPGSDKMLNLPRHGAAVLYPEAVLRAEGDLPVLLCEGELDALLANQEAQGQFIAVTGTGGADTVPKDLSALAGREVFVAYDCDDAGQKGALAIAERLANVAASVRVLDLTRLGLEVGSKQDVTDLLLAREDAASALIAEIERLRAEPQQQAHRRFHSGGSFILDQPTNTPVVWGEGERVLWAEGEGLLLVGGDGVGKSTLAQQLMLARLGLRDTFLGLPVAPAQGKVLYLAMDRPRQIRRSLARMVTEEDRALLDARLAFWEGPLPFDPTANAQALADWIDGDLGSGFSDVIADSMKDLAPGLSDDKVGAAINSAMQEVLARGMQWLGLHHNRKPAADRTTEYGIADVYGSRWLTAGMGSVVLVVGDAGSPEVQLRHVKQPVALVGPLLVAHEHSEGRSSVRRPRTNALGVLQESPGEEFTTKQITEAVWGKSDAAARKRVLRELERLTLEHDEVHKVNEGRGGRGGSTSVGWVFRPDSQRTEQRT